MRKKVSILVAMSLTVTLFASSTSVTWFSTEVKASETTAVTGVLLNKSNATLKVGQTYTLTATEQNVTWTSNDINIATVDSSGKITAVSNGTVAITATTADNSSAATCSVTVGSQDMLLHYDFNNDSSTSTINDSSVYDNNGIIKGSGSTIANGELTLPGGASSSYVELPKGIFDKHDTLTISMWLKNDTGKGNYAAMFFGTTESYPSQYWILNPCNPSGLFKSVITNGLNASAPYNTETGISPTLAARGILGPKTDNNWAFYTTVIEPTGITGYYNGVKVGTVATNRTVTQFGTGLVSYIGRSSYGDPYLKGSIRDVKVYSAALTEAEIKADNAKTVLAKDKKNLSLAETNVISNLTLPSSGSNGSTITWKSSNTQYISDDGIVTRPVSGDANVIMTATLSKDGVQDTKEFNIVVLANTPEKDLAYLNKIASNFDIGITYATEDLSLPTITKEGVAISWKSSDESIISSAGKVTRQETGDEKVTLTAVLEFGQGKIEKDFEVTVAEKTYGYLLSYVLSGNTDRTDCLHMAYSKDGQSYTALQDNKGICYTSNGAKKMGAPVIFRKADGTYGLIASDDNSSSYIVVMDSDDLIDYKNERYVQVNKQGIKVINPSCHFDASVNAYRINFVGSDGNSYTTTTADFVTFTDLIKITYTKEAITETIPTGAIESGKFEVTKSEYDRVVGKYSRITNTGIKAVPNVEVQAGNTLALPQKVTAEYSDGSTKDMGVIWNQDELKNVNTTKAGAYTITGAVQQKIYPNPLIEERADPDVVLGSDGYYYFTASYPTYGDSDKEGYDRIILRRSKTIEGLKTEPEITIWDEANSTENRYVWAPEIHNINGKWYIFYTSSISSSVWGIKPHVLACEGDGDPYKPENWVEKGQVKPAAGDTTSFSGFSLDMTYFECNGKHYVAWAEKPDSSNIYMATIDPSEPWKLTSNAILMTTPEYAWEWEGSTKVNEGPAVLKHDGKIFLCYSASAVDASYCVGMLSADENADLMNISSWTKNAYPILSTDDLNDEYGPGHNSFTVDEYGNDVIVYHARPEECNNNTCAYASSSDLNDPHRHTRVKNVNYAVDGAPILNMTYEEELADANKTVAVTINISGSVVSPKAVTVTGKASVGNTLTAQLIDENGGIFTTSAAVTYEWYRDAELVEGENGTTYNLSDDDNSKKISVKVAQYNLISEEIYISADSADDDKEPVTLEITRDDDTLTSILKNEDGSEFTTDAAVTYEWYRDAELVEGETSDKYNLSDADKGTSIKVKVPQYNLKSESIDIVDDSTPIDEDATPATVRIDGTERVGYTLEAQLLAENGAECTTSAAVTYEWYRLSSEDSEDGELVGDNKTYKLVANDKGNYIKLVATCEEKTFEDITSRIVKKSSSSSSKSSSSSSSNSTDSDTDATDSNTATSENSDSSNNGATTINNGWKNNNDNTWAYVENGQPVIGWKQVDNSWYLMDSTGTMQIGWKQTNGIWYLLKDNGAMATGWVQTNGKWYYLYSDGAMAYNTIIDGYQLNENGAMAE